MDIAENIVTIYVYYHTKELLKLQEKFQKCPSLYIKI